MNNIEEQIEEIIYKVTKDYRLQHKSGEYYETDLLFDDLVHELYTFVETSKREAVREFCKYIDDNVEAHYVDSGRKVNHYQRWGKTYLQSLDGGDK